MATYLNHVAIATPRNGTTTHTVTPSSGSVVAGTAFTPAAGNLLVCLVEGAVTSSTPSGWTLPSDGSAVNNTGLYVWYRTAAGSDSLSTTHNAANYPAVFHFVEFASGSTFGTAGAATAVNAGGAAGPSLSGLAGAPWVAAAMGQAYDLTGSVSVTWSAGTELADTSTPRASSTDGYTYSLAYIADHGSATFSASAASTYFSNTVERLVFSVAAAGGGASGTVAVVGAGAVTARATQRAGSSASGVGAVSATAGVTATGTAAVGGVGTVTAKARQGATGSVVGAGAVAATGTVPIVLAGTAAVVGAGEVSAVRSTPIAGSATVGGAGAVIAGALITVSDTAAVLGLGAVVAAPSVGFVDTATAVGAGAVLAFGAESVPPAPTWLLRPPTVGYRHPGARWSIPRGVSLVVHGPAVRAEQWVDNAEWGTADHVYLGGHEHVVSEAEAMVLTDAGYGSYLTPNL